MQSAKTYAYLFVSFVDISEIKSYKLCLWKSHGSIGKHAYCFCLGILFALRQDGIHLHHASSMGEKQIAFLKQIPSVVSIIEPVCGSSQSFWGCSQEMADYHTKQSLRSLYVP